MVLPDGVGFALHQLQNAALLIFGLVAWAQVRPMLRAHIGLRLDQLLYGGAMGALGFLSILVPVEILPGVRVGTLGAPVLVGALFAGPAGGLVALATALAARLLLGGPLAVHASVSLVLLWAIAAAVAHRLRRAGREPGWRTLATVTTASIAVSLGVTLIAPGSPIAADVTLSMVLAWSLVTFVATICFGGVALFYESEMRLRAALRRSEAQLREAHELGEMGYSHTDPATGLVTFSDSLARVRGLPPGQSMPLAEATAVFHPDDRRAYQIERNLAIAQHRPFEMDVRVLLPGGGMRWEHVVGRPEFDERGRLVDLFVLFRDVTRERAAETALRQSEERYALLFEGGRDGMFDLDLVAGQVWVSERAHQILGVPDGTLNGSPALLRARVHPDDVAADRAELARCFAAREPYVARQFRARHESGFWRWIETRGRIVYAEDGTPQRIVGSFGDITSRKSTEAALIESRTLLLEAQRVGRVGTLTYDAVSQRVHWSDTLFELRRVPPREFFTRDEAMAFVHPDDRAVYLAARDAGLAGRRDFACHTRILRPDGTIGWEHTIGHPRFDESGSFRGLLLVIRDVTDIREAELALRQSEERLTMAIDGMREGVFDRDVATGRIWFSTRLHEMLGVPDGSLNGDRAAFAALIHPDDRGPYEAAVRQWIEERRDFGTSRFRMRRSDGAWRWIHFRGSMLYDAAGRLVRSIGSIGDATEQILAEQALQQSERRFRALIEHSNDVVLVVAPGGRIVYRSPSATTVFGRTDAEVLNRPFLDQLHPEDASAVQAALDRLARDDAGQASGRMRVRHRDGSWRHVDWSAHGAADVPGIEGVIVNLRDVTDAVRLEAQLMQAQKMEAVGRLAGGIAHDFNNILGAIVSFSRFLIEDLPAGSREQDHARRIAQAGNRGKQLVQQILAFSRQASVERAPHDLGLLLDEVRGLLQAALPSSTALTVTVRQEDLVADVNGAQITQILLNLCLNANDAFAGRSGRIAIELAAIEPGHADYGAGPDRPDAARDDGATTVGWGELDPAVSYARLSITDDGAGMSPAVLARVFEPFFTTKPVGRGTGLGLSVVHGIVLAYGGAGHIRSAPGAGTRVTIYLPLTDGEAEPDADVVAAVMGQGRVLLVDDDLDVIEGAAQALRRVGYTVMPLTDPRAACALFTAAPDAWDVVVSDQTMPGLSGLSLFESLKAHHPDLRFILCTGYGDGAIETAAQDAGIAQVLIKPVSPDRLARCVRQIVGH